MSNRTTRARTNRAFACWSASWPNPAQRWSAGIGFSSPQPTPAALTSRFFRALPSERRLRCKSPIPSTGRLAAGPDAMGWREGTTASPMPCRPMRLAASSPQRASELQTSAPLDDLSATAANEASLPARKSASSAMRHSRKLRIASWSTPARPLRAPCPATDARTSSSVFLRSVGGGEAASVMETFSVKFVHCIS